MFSELPPATPVAAFLKSFALEPPIKTGTPDPYLPPKPGELRIEEHIQLGVIAQFVTTLVKAYKQAPPPDTGIQGNTG
jgi:arylsulfatase